MTINNDDDDNDDCGFGDDNGDKYDDKLNERDDDLTSKFHDMSLHQSSVFRVYTNCFWRCCSF